jgi:uncharacterized membrane protein
MRPVRVARPQAATRKGSVMTTTVQPYRIGSALSWACHNINAAMIVATLVYGVVLVGVEYLVGLVTPATSNVDSPVRGDAAARAARFLADVATPHGIAALLGTLLLLVVVAMVQSAYFSGMLDVADGRPVTVGSFFKPHSVGSAIVAAVIADLLVALSFSWFFVGGILAGSLLMFTVVAQLDRNLSPVDAVKTSFGIGAANFGKAILAALTVYLVLLVGVLACGVGLFIAVPVASFFLVYTYRYLAAGLVSRTNGTAIAAFVFGMLLPPIGIIIGFIARGQIKRTGEDGRGLATTGLVVGVILTLIPIAAVLTLLLAHQ